MRALRLSTVIASALLAQLSAPPPASAQDQRSGNATRTDQTLSVVRGTRLSVESLSGVVLVRGWDKDAVRVQARHSAATHVSVRNTRAVVSVESDSGGHSGRVEYEINVPRWMAVAVEVTFADITIEGTEAAVSAETVRGNVMVRGGAGSVQAESVEGRAVVEGAKGRVEVSSTNDLIRVDGVVGEISASTTNGAVTLTNIQSAMVEASTVNGSITYDGGLEDAGHYSLSTHNGDILVFIPSKSNATFDVRTYNGTFRPDLPLKGTAPTRRGGRAIYTLGNGSARLELESFGGSIRIQDAGAAPGAGKPQHE